MASSSSVLSIYPPDLVFRDVHYGQTYAQQLSIKNTLNGSVEFSVKPGSAARYSVHPECLRARPGETVAVTVRLKVIKFAHRQRAQATGQRDVFHIKGQYFDQKFSSIFFLAPDAVEPTCKALPSVARATARTPSPDLRSPRLKDQEESAPSSHSVSRAASTQRACVNPQFRQHHFDRGCLQDGASDDSGSLSFAPVGHNSPGGASHSTSCSQPTPCAARPMALRHSASAYHQSPTSTLRPAQQQHRQQSHPASHEEATESADSPISSPTFAPRPQKPPSTQQELQEGGGDSCSPSASSPTFAAFSQLHDCDDTDVSSATPNSSSSQHRPPRASSPVAPISFGDPSANEGGNDEREKEERSRDQGPECSISFGGARLPQPSVGSASPTGSISSGRPYGQPHSTHGTAAGSASPTGFVSFATQQGQRPNNSNAPPSPPPPGSTPTPSSSSFNFASAQRFPPPHAVSQTPAIGRTAAAVSACASNRRVSASGNPGSSCSLAPLASGDGAAREGQHEYEADPRCASAPTTIAGEPTGADAVGVGASTFEKRGTQAKEGGGGSSGGVVVLAIPVLPKRTGRGVAYHTSDNMQRSNDSSCSSSASSNVKHDSVVAHHQTPSPATASSSSSSSSSAPPAPRNVCNAPTPHSTTSRPSSPRSPVAVTFPHTQQQQHRPQLQQAQEHQHALPPHEPVLVQPPNPSTNHWSGPPSKSHAPTSMAPQPVQGSVLSQPSASVLRAPSNAAGSTSHAAQPSPSQQQKQQQQQQQSSLHAQRQAHAVLLPPKPHVASTQSSISVQQQQQHASMPIVAALSAAAPSQTSTLSVRPGLQSSVALPAGSDTDIKDAFTKLRLQFDVQRAELQSRLHDAWGREEQLRAACQSQLQALDDKENIMTALHAQLELARQDRELLQCAPGNPHYQQQQQQSGTEAQAGSQHYPPGALLSENKRLHAQIKDLEAQLLRSHNEVAALRRMQTELQASAPDTARLITAAVESEQALQEDRNHKALGLLMTKDQQIQELQQQVASTQDELAMLQQSCRDALGRAAATEAGVVAALRSKEELRVEQEQERGRMAEQMAALHAELLQFRTSAPIAKDAEARAAEAEQALAEVKEQLCEAAAEAASLQEQLQQAGKQIKHLEEEATRSSAAQAERMASVAAAHHQALADLEGRLDRQHGGSFSVRPSSQQQEVLTQRVLDLENMNKQLEDALLQGADGAPFQKTQQHHAQTTAKGQGAAAPGRQPQAQHNLQQQQYHQWQRDQQQQEQQQSQQEQAAQLARVQAELRMAKDRVRALEAALAVAQHGGSRDEEHRQAVLHSAAEARRSANDAELAHTTAARLRAQVAELVKSEAEARSMAAEASRTLARAEEQHSRDMHATEERLQLMTSDSSREAAHAAAENGSGPQDAMAHARAVDEAREAQLQQAVEESERALAVVQARLLEALKAKAVHEAEAAAAKHASDQNRLRLESEVRAAREEGMLRIRTLDESLARLSNVRGSGEAAVEAARAVAEAEKAKRGEARARADAAHAKELLSLESHTVAELRARLQDADAAMSQLWVYTQFGPAAAPVHPPMPFCKGPQPIEPPAHTTLSLNGLASADPAPAPAPAGTPMSNAAAAAATSSAAALPVGTAEGRGAGAGASDCVYAGQQGGCVASYRMLERRLRSQYEELVRRQQMIAGLSEAAETARSEAHAAKAEMEHLRGMVPNPDNPHERQVVDMSKRVGALEAELQAACQARERAQLAAERQAVVCGELRREVEAARTAGLAQEAALAAAKDAAARSMAQVHGTLSAELAALHKRASDADFRSNQLQQELEEAAAEGAAARAECARVMAMVDTVQQGRAAEKEAAAEELAAARTALEGCKRDVTRALQEAEQRCAQVTVLMETIETLQAGSAGEANQRMLSLTAQLAAARAREALQDARCEELIEECGAAKHAAAASATAARTISVAAREQAQQLANAEGVAQAMAQRLEAARADAKTQSAIALQSMRDLDDLRARLSVLEAEAEGLRSTMLDMQSRHIEQINRERDDAAETLRHARNPSRALGPHLGGGTLQSASEGRFVSILEGPLQELLTQVSRRVDAQGAKDVAWVLEVMHKLKAVTLEAEKLHHHAAADARISYQGAREASARVAAQTAQLEHRTAEAQASQLAKQRLQRMAGRRAQQATSHASQLVVELTQRVSTLRDLLDTATASAVEATAASSCVSADLAAERSRGDALQQQLQLAMTDVRELGARLAAAQLEVAAAGGDNTGGLDSRALAEFVGAQVGRLALAPEPKDKIVALMRALCAARQSEAHLQASLAGAQRRADASLLAAQEAREACRATEARLSALCSNAASAVSGYHASSTCSTAPRARAEHVTNGGGVHGAATSSPSLNNAAGAGQLQGIYAQHTLSPEPSPNARSNSMNDAANNNVCASSAQQLATNSSSTRDAVINRGSALADRTGGAGSNSKGRMLVGPWQAVHDAARLRAQLALSLREQHGMRDKLLAVQQALEQRELDVSECHAQAAAQELVIQQARDEACTSLMAQRQQLDEAHDVDRALLLREITELQTRLASMQQLAARDLEEADARLAAVRCTVDEELNAAINRALENHVEVSQLHVAKAQAAKAEREAARTQREAEALREEVARLHTQVAELTDSKEVTSAAVSSLQAVLTRLESSPIGHPPVPKGSQASDAGRIGTGGGSLAMQRRQGTVGTGATATEVGKGTPAASSVAALSKELVRAKLAEVEAVKRSRVSARAEVQLRQRLLQRDARILELKEVVAALEGRKSSPARAAPGTQIHTTHSLSRGRSTVPCTPSSKLRSRSPTPPSARRLAPTAATYANNSISNNGSGCADSQQCTASAPHARGKAATSLTLRTQEAAAATPTGATPCSGSKCSGGKGESGGVCSRAAELEAQLEAWAADYDALSDAVAKAGIEAARKDAEIAWLEAELAAATSRLHLPVSAKSPHSPQARSSPEGAERLRVQLCAASASLATSLTHANVLLRKLGATDTNGLSTRCTGEVSASGSLGSQRDSRSGTLSSRPTPPLTSATAVGSRSMSPPCARQRPCGDSSTGHGPAGSFEAIDTPDPALLPTLLCVAMERLEHAVTARLGLGEGRGGRSGSPVCGPGSHSTSFQPCGNTVLPSPTVAGIPSLAAALRVTPPTGRNDNPHGNDMQQQQQQQQLPCSSLLPPWVPSNSNPRSWSNTPGSPVERLLGNEVVASHPSSDGLRRYLRDPCSYADGRCRGAATCRAGHDTLAALQLEGLEDVRWTRDQRTQQRMREVYEQAMIERTSLAQQLQQHQQSRQQQQQQQQIKLPQSSKAPLLGNNGTQVPCHTCCGTGKSSSSLKQPAGHLSNPNDDDSSSNHGLNSTQARRLVGLLQRGIASLYGACKGVEAACRAPKPKPSEVQQQVGVLESGLRSLEGTLGVLAAEARRPPAASAQSQLPQAKGPLPLTPAVSPPSQPHNATEVAPEVTAAESSEGFSFGVQVGGHSAKEEATPDLQRRPPSGRCSASNGSQGEATPCSSATTSSSEPSLQGLTDGSQCGASQEDAHSTLLPRALGTDQEGSNATSALLAERLLAARARTEKWKARACHLGHQLALLGAGTSTREAAVAERVAAAEGAAEERAHRLRAEVQRLEAALVGTESARRELEQRTAQLALAAAEAATAAASSTPGSAGGHDSHSQDVRGPKADQGHTVHAAHAEVPHAAFGAARVAELSARCAALEQQLEAERAQGATRCNALMGEASGLRGAIAQERSERVRLLGGMRGALSGLGSCSDPAGRLRQELLDAHQAAAAAQSAQERAEAQADTWRAEARVLRERLQTSEKARLSALQALEARLLTAERHCARMADTYAARTEELAGRLSAFASTAAAAVPTGCEEQLQLQQQRLCQLEGKMAVMAGRLAEQESGARQQDAAGRWSWVTQAARYQRAIKMAMQEVEVAERKAQLERAELKAHLTNALDHAGATASQLQDCQLKAAEAAQAAELERQRMSSLHLSHIAELERRIEDERRAMAEDAAVHAESLARSREGAAAASGAAALAQAEARHSQELEQSKAGMALLQRQLENLGHAFRAYQATRAAEVAALEERVIGLINTAHQAPDQLHDEQGPHPKHARAAQRSGSDALAAGRRAKSSVKAASLGIMGRGKGQAASRRCTHAVHSVARSSSGRRYTRAGAAGHMPMRSCGLCIRLQAAAAEGKPGCTQHAQVRHEGVVDDVGSDVRASRADQTRDLLHRRQQTAMQDSGDGSELLQGQSWGLCEGPRDWRGLQDMVAAVAEERVEAVKREALFERLYRQRAEASAHAAHKALTSARLRLRYLQHEAQQAAAREAAELQREKDGWIAGEAHAAVVSDLVSCREALRSVRAESARRQRALQALQSLANAGLLRSPQHANGLPNGAAAASGKGGEKGEGGVDPLVANAAHAAAVAAAAAANAACGVATEVSANLDMFHGKTGDVQEAVHGYGGLRALIDAAAARTATAALLERAAQKHQSDGSDDPFCIAAETATAAAAAAAAALEAEHAGREAAESKLREARGSVDSKNARIKELKRRIEEMEAELKEAQQTDVRAALTVLEGRIKQANAAVARKDALIKELKDRLEATKQQAAASSQQANQQQRAAQDAGESSEAERHAHTITRLRCDLAKREASLKAALAELEKERQEAAVAAHSSWEAGNQEAKALRQAAAAMQQRSCELMQAVRALLRLVLRCSDASSVSALAKKQQQGTVQGKAQPPSSYPQQQPSAQQPRHSSSGAPPGGLGLSESDIASLTNLSLLEVQDLLGPSSGCASGTGSVPSSPLSQQQMQHQQRGRAQGLHSITEDNVRGRCDELLSVMEATLLPHGVGVGADVSGEASAGKRKGGVTGASQKQLLMLWEPENLKLLLEAAEQRVQAVERLHA